MGKRREEAGQGRWADSIEGLGKLEENEEDLS